LYLPEEEMKSNDSRLQHSKHRANLGRFSSRVGSLEVLAPIDHAYRLRMCRFDNARRGYLLSHQRTIVSLHRNTLIGIQINRARPLRAHFQTV
jgi:hypothetical protein